MKLKPYSATALTLEGVLLIAMGLYFAFLFAVYGEDYRRDLFHDIFLKISGKEELIKFVKEAASYALFVL